MSQLIQFAVVIALSAIQFFSDKISIEKSRFRGHIASFASAVAISYLLLNLIPKAYQDSSGVELFLPVMAGFTSIHLLEKFFYRKFEGNFSIKSIKSYHDELHAAVLFMYHFVIGIVLIDVLEGSLAAGFLFLPPLLMFTTIGNWSMHHEYLREFPYRKALLASSTVLGALFAKSDLMTPLVGKIMFNFALGILLFIIVRESLPKKNEGRPEIFVLGALAYGLLVLLIEGWFQ